MKVWNNVWHPNLTLQQKKMDGSYLKQGQPYEMENSRKRAADVCIAGCP